jgi:hypothetical protein
MIPPPPLFGLRRSLVLGRPAEPLGAHHGSNLCLLHPDKTNSGLFQPNVGIWVRASQYFDSNIVRVSVLTLRRN